MSLHVDPTTSLAAGQHDFALEELSPSLRVVLGAQTSDWLSSLAFSTCYMEHGATRVHLSVNEAGHVTQVFFYTEQRWLGWWLVLHVFGPVQVKAGDARQLLATRHAHAMIIHRMGGGDIYEEHLPWHRFAVQRNGEDFVAELPETPAAYLAALASNLQKRLPYYERRLRRELGEDYRAITAAGEEIDRALFSRLVEMNAARMTHKGVKPGWTSHSIEQRWRLAQQQGTLYGVLHGQTLIGGAMVYRHQDDAILGIIAHDVAYDHLHVGYVCVWQSIQQLIAGGATRYRFLWGYLRYKVDFGGKLRKLYDLVIFRNSLIAVLWHLRYFIPMRVNLLRTYAHERLTLEQFDRLRGMLRKLRLR